MGEASTENAFLYSGSSITDLGTLPTGLGSFASAVNDLGQVVGGSQIGVSPTSSGSVHAFLYSDGSMIDLGTLGGTRSNGTVVSAASGINKSGQVVGYSLTAGDTYTHAFLYSDGSMTDLGTLGGSGSAAYGINDSGQVVGVAATAGDTQSHAFLYSCGKMVDLGTLGGTISYASAVNNSGQVVGVATTAGDIEYHAFLYTGGAMIDLNDIVTFPVGINSSLYGATAINDLGQIAAYDYFAGFGFLLTPQPSSSDLRFGSTAPSALPCSATVPRITSPADDASPKSAFVALAGTGQAGNKLDVIVNGSSVGAVAIDAEGKWEALPYVGGVGSIHVRDRVTSEVSNSITVTTLLPGSGQSPEVPVSNGAYLPLRHADILVTSGRVPSSIGEGLISQYFLYGPTYTHEALYLGGDASGTPIIAEAVPPGEAGALGQVRSVSFEQSTVWTDSFVVSAFQPNMTLTGAYKDATVAWAKNITSKGLPYWSPGDFALIPAAYALFSISGGTLTPRVKAFLDFIDTNKDSTGKFMCSTLVWQAYWEGTGHTLDISTPNNMTAQPGSILTSLSPAFLRQLAPVFIVPDTIALSPKLSQIF